MLGFPQFLVFSQSLASSDSRFLWCPYFWVRIRKDGFFNKGCVVSGSGGTEGVRGATEGGVNKGNAGILGNGGVVGNGGAVGNGRELGKVCSKSGSDERSKRKIWRKIW